MPRRRESRRKTRSAIPKILAKICRHIIRWRTLILALYIFPIALLINVVYCWFIPYTYPTTNLKDIVRVRSIENQPPLFSSVTFVDVPINTKQRIEATLDSLLEIDIEYTEEIYLKDYPGLTFKNFTFLSLEEVFSLEVFFEGHILDYYYFENGEQKYYVIENFTVIQKEKIHKLEVFSTIKPRTRTSKSINIPWIFNENYARVIYLPLTNIAVQNNMSSDLCTIKIDLNVPLRRILMDQSGWADLFICPPYEWKEICIPFDYPIEQESRNDKTLYVFSTHFSEDNVASKIFFSLIPKEEVLWIPLIFLLVPLLFNSFHPNFGYGKMAEKRNNEKKTSEGTTCTIKAITTRTLWLYSVPILSLVGLLVTGTPILLALGFIKEITNPFMFWLILVYPTLLAFTSYAYMRE